MTSRGVTKSPENAPARLPFKQFYKSVFSMYIKGVSLRFSYREYWMTPKGMSLLMSVK